MRTSFIIKKYYPIFLIIAVWIVFSSPFLFFGKTPFPSTYQVNFFSPWATYPEMKGPVKNNAQPDIITQIYPWRYFTINEIKEGRIPLWNPYSFAGTPHLANYQSAVLFPLNILFFLPLSFIDAWSILVLLQPLLAGLFMYLLMKRLKVSNAGSFVASMSFMFCGFLVTWLGYATLGYAIIPLPLAIFSILQYVDKKKLIWLILLSFTFPLSFFAGHFQTSLYFCIGVLLFIIYNLIFSREKKPYLYSLLFAGIGLLLTMPQVLPSMEFYSLSNRSELFRKIEAIPLQYLITFFSPDFYGNPVTRNDWYGRYAEWNGYIGTVSLSLALFTAFFARNKKTGFFILLAAASLILALDTPLQTLIVALKVPVLSTSAASRIIVLFSFSAAVLAGFGLDEINKQITDKRKIVVWGLTAIVLFLSLSGIGYMQISESGKQLIAQKNSILPLVSLLFFIGLGFVTLFVKKKNSHYLFLFASLGLITFEMYRFASKWQNFDSKEIAYRDVAIANFYNSQNHYDRAIGLSGGEDAVYYKMPVLSGYDPLYKKEYGELVQFIGNGTLNQPERSVVTFPNRGSFTPSAIDFLGVHFVIHKVADGIFPWAFPFNNYPLSQFSVTYEDASYKVFKNNNAFNRAFLVSTVQKLPSQKIPEVMFQNDLRKIAYVEEDIENVSASSGSAKIIEYLPGKITIQTTTTENSFLVLTDNYYPGWIAKINGESTKIYKTNYTFRGVAVPKGSNTIVFSYLPMSFFVGIYLFLLGILAIIVIISLKLMGGKK